jgi:hypothetical protein
MNKAVKPIMKSKSIFFYDFTELNIELYARDT